MRVQSKLLVMTHKTVSSNEATSESSDLPSTEVIIAHDGDVILEMKNPRLGLDNRYRCSRARLRSNSEYFDILLSPTKFSEGIAIEARLNELGERYTNFASIPVCKLPAVILPDVGQLPKASLSTNMMITLFLKILHDPHTSWPTSRLYVFDIVASLAIVADRLAAIQPIRAYIKSQKLENTLLRDRKICTPRQLEIDNRQRLLAGVIFGFPLWVREYSAALILAGPSREVTTDMNSGDEERAEDDALWWRLPNGIEGMHRLIHATLITARL